VLFRTNTNGCLSGDPALLPSCEEAKDEMATAKLANAITLLESITNLANGNLALVTDRLVVGGKKEIVSESKTCCVIHWLGWALSCLGLKSIECEVSLFFYSP